MSNPPNAAPSRPSSSQEIITHSPTMRSLYEAIEAVAKTDTTVLIIGETGVGKELLAEHTHRTSLRSNKAYIKVGLSTLQPELLESELFGHEKGAFTHAINAKKGLFELADGGTIFLDDIDDFPTHLQVKLLRVLESSELMHVGGTASIAVDARVICATKVDLHELVQKGLFRSDLYYRINVVPIVIPPLRARQEDIPIFINHFLARYAFGREVRIEPGAMQALTNYAWPGNIRELRNVIQRIALFAGDLVSVSDLPSNIRERNTVNTFLKRCHNCFADGDLSLDELLACLEVNMLRGALQHTHGNKTHAAKYLRLSLSTFRDKLKKYKLDEKDQA